MTDTQVKWYISQFNPLTKLSTSIKVMDQLSRTVLISVHRIREDFIEFVLCGNGDHIIMIWS